MDKRTLFLLLVASYLPCYLSTSRSEWARGSALQDARGIDVTLLPEDVELAAHQFCNWVDRHRDAIWRPEWLPAKLNNRVPDPDDGLPASPAADGEAQQGRDGCPGHAQQHQPCRPARLLSARQEEPQGPGEEEKQGELAGWLASQGYFSSGAAVAGRRASAPPWAAVPSCESR